MNSAYREAIGCTPYHAVFLTQPWPPARDRSVHWRDREIATLTYDDGEEVLLDAAGTSRAFPDGVPEGLQAVTNRRDNLANDPRDEEDQPDDPPVVLAAQINGIEGREDEVVIAESAERGTGGTSAPAGATDSSSAEGFRLPRYLQPQQRPPSPQQREQHRQQQEGGRLERMATRTTANRSRIEKIHAAPKGKKITTFSAGLGNDSI